MEDDYGERYTGRDHFRVTELSQRVGITLANMSILKTGKAKAIRITTLAALCEVLDCQPGDLLEYRKTED